MDILKILNALYIKLFNDIQSWSYTNSVIINASGFTIGYATFYFISETIALLSPFFKMIKNNIISLGKNIGIHKIKFIYIFIYPIFTFIQLAFVWLITLFFTFIFLEYVLNIKILGLKSNIKDNEKKDFIISKTEAKNKDSILENKDKIINKEEKEKIIGEKIIKSEVDTLNKLVNDNNELNNENINFLRDKENKLEYVKMIDSIM